MREVLYLPTSQLLTKFHPENPQVHSEDNDIPKIKQSLLHFGWLQYITIQAANNQPTEEEGEFDFDANELGYLISGHGRVLAAAELSKEPQDYFDQQWKKWLGTSKDKQKIADEHQERFFPQFWKKCPVIPTVLDDLSQKAALIRLNDTQGDGQADPVKIAALLSQMKKPQQELSGWTPSVANNFIAAYTLKKEQAAH